MIHIKANSNSLAISLIPKIKSKYQFFTRLHKIHKIFFLLSRIKIFVIFYQKLIKNPKIRQKVLHPKIILIFLFCMSIEFPQFIKIKDFAHYEKDSLETEIQDLSSKYKKHTLEETKDQQKAVTEKSQSRLLQIYHSELSFQKSFMNQHIETYDFKVKTYLEQTFQNDVITPLDFLSEDISGVKTVPAECQGQIEYYLRSKVCSLGTQESQILMEKYQKHQKLYEFLQYTCQKSCDQISLDLITLGKHALEQYQKFEKDELTYQQIIENVKKLTEENWQKIGSKKFLPFLKFQNFTRQPSLIQAQRNAIQKQFIEFLLITFSLAASEYVNNPYYEQKLQAQLKRHKFFNNSHQVCDYEGFSSSEDEQECEVFSHSRKRRK